MFVVLKIEKIVDQNMVLNLNKIYLILLLNNVFFKFFNFFFINKKTYKIR